jgi:hypothetical protein
MTSDNTELLAAIRAIIREELERERAIEPDDLITAGPDEDGRVRFLGTENVNKNCWVFSILTVQQAAEGRIPPLTEKQLATLQMNVGCDPAGNLQPIGPGRLYGQTGKPAVDEMSPLANKCVKAATFFQPGRYVFAEAFKQSNDDRTISSRSTNIKTLIASVAGLGLLGVNDGSGFRIP